MPEGADFEALPAAQRSGRAGCGSGVGQLMCDGPAAHGGRVHFQVQAAMDFGGGKAIRSGRSGREELAQERFDLGGPVRCMIATGRAGSPAVWVLVSGGAEVIGIQLVEARAAQPKHLGGGHSGDFTATERGQNFTNQRST